MFFLFRELLDSLCPHWFSGIIHLVLTVMKSWHANMERVAAETAGTLATVSLQLKNMYVYDSYVHLNPNNYLIIKKKAPFIGFVFPSCPSRGDICYNSMHTLTHLLLTSLHIWTVTKRHIYAAHAVAGLRPHCWLCSFSRIHCGLCVALYEALCVCVAQREEMDAWNLAMALRAD